MVDDNIEDTDTVAKKRKLPNWLSSPNDETFEKRKKESSQIILKNSLKTQTEEINFCNINPSTEPNCLKVIENNDSFSNESNSNQSNFNNLKNAEVKIEDTLNIEISLKTVKQEPQNEKIVKKEIIEEIVERDESGENIELRNENIQLGETIKIKKEIIENINEIVNENATSNLENGSNQDPTLNSNKIKEEISENVDGGNSSTSNRIPVAAVSPLVVKTEPQANTSLRPSCKYGIKCYRQNPTHKVEEAHPGDNDYRRPQYPDPPKGTALCPYGNFCYRRNPLHFQQFSHPPQTNFHQNFLDRKNRLRDRIPVLYKTEYSDEDTSSDDFSIGSENEYDAAMNMDEESSDEIDEGVDVD